MASVTFDGVGKTYPDGTTAVHGLRLEIADGEFLVFVGPSGCGKTTALRMVAGLEEITEGVLRIGERHRQPRPVARSGHRDGVPELRALSAPERVREHRVRAQGARRWPKGRDRPAGREAARVLDLEPLLERKPRALSGGQRQRVAMGRAIVREPAAFLMDEPLSNLDAKLRVQMRAEISRLQHSLGTTTIYVTHDQVEAMTMGERVAVMRKGELQQVAEPQELYDRPVNLFVGGFIGSPSMNMVEATLERANGGLVAAAGSERIAHRLPETLAGRPALSGYEGKMVILGIRPEDLEDAALATGTPGASAAARARRAEGGARLGDHGAFRGRRRHPPEPPRWSSSPRTCTAPRARSAWSRPRPAESIMIGRFGARSRVQQGDEIEIAVDTRALHFFDPETGLGIYQGS